jgi:hypothetical protein
MHVPCEPHRATHINPCCCGRGAPHPRTHMLAMSGPPAPAGPPPPPIMPAALPTPSGPVRDRPTPARRAAFPHAPHALHVRQGRVLQQVVERARAHHLAGHLHEGWVRQQRTQVRHAPRAPRPPACTRGRRRRLGGHCHVIGGAQLLLRLGQLVPRALIIRLQGYCTPQRLCCRRMLAQCQPCGPAPRPPPSSVDGTRAVALAHAHAPEATVRLGVRRIQADSRLAVGHRRRIVPHTQVRGRAVSVRVPR